MGLVSDSLISLFKQVIEIMKEIFDTRLLHCEMNTKQI